MEKVGESSQVDAVESQIALDEALALALQELENQFGDTSFGESTGNESDKDVSSSEPTPASASTANRERNSAAANAPVRQDIIDPDNMTYEELQSLNESIGTEGRGLSEEFLSYLPSVKYKRGFFSKKEHEECVICCMKYKNRDILTTLPCQHQYHKKCVNKWLRLNKVCPVCNEEVFG